MPRLTPLDPMAATGETKELLDGIQSRFGMIPNTHRAMAVNPAVLKAWVELTGALGPTLDGQLNERIAIAIAEENGCGYCLAAHTAAGRAIGIDEDELARSRTSGSSDPKIAAALQFAQTVNAKRGGVSDDDFAKVRAAGYDDADIAAIVGQVVLNVLTNYFNRVAQPVIEFREVAPLEQAA